MLGLGELGNPPSDLSSELYCCMAKDGGGGMISVGEGELGREPSDSSDLYLSNLMFAAARLPPA